MSEDEIYTIKKLNLFIMWYTQVHLPLQTELKEGYVFTLVCLLAGLLKNVIGYG